MMTELEYIKEMLQRLEAKVDALTTQQNDIIGIEEASKFTGYTKGTIYNLAQKRLIPHFKRGKMLVFDRSKLGEWMMESPVKTQSTLKAEAATYLATRK